MKRAAPNSPEVAAEEVQAERTKKNLRTLFSTAVPSPRSTRASGKYVIVTGGTQGCGECCALMLAEEGAAGITICGRSAENGAKVKTALGAMGCRAIFVKADLGEVEDCLKVVRCHDEAFGQCHGLVNCAATTGRGRWDDTTPELFDRVYHLNVRGPFLLMQAAVKLMEREKSGILVPIAAPCDTLRLYAQTCRCSVTTPLPRNGPTHSAEG